MMTDSVRLATLADVPQMAQVFADGFIDDDVCGRFMHPRRREHPDDWVRFWIQSMTTHVLEPAGLCYVRVDDGGRVMGCMILQRVGEGAKARKAAESYIHQLQRQRYVLQHSIENRVWPDKSADQDAILAFDRNWDDIKHHFTGNHAETWMIEFLCIHSDAQKKGYGRDLVHKAVEVCKAERPALPLCVIASDIGDAFYEKYGFGEVGRANVGALKDVKGGSLKFYEEHLK